MAIEILLTNGMKALVDAHRAKDLIRYTWTARRVRRKNRYVWYAVRTMHHNGEAVSIGMHQQIMGTWGTKQHIDHRDGDGLNNQDTNLRVATRSQNGGNRTKQPGTSSKYKGVSFYTRQSLWCARVRRKGKTEYSSYHQDQEHAASAYNAAALRTFGEFAKLNTITKEITCH